MCGCNTSVCGCEDVTLPTGEQGYNGWTPILANVIDSVNLDDEGNYRVVQRIIGWTGGSGPVPSVFLNYYISPTGPVAAIASGTNIRGASDDPYVVYTAHISQTASSNPGPIVIFENTLGTITFARTSTGLYTATSVGLFTAGKTCVILNRGALTTTALDYAVTVSNVNTILIETRVAGALADSALAENPFEIRVYN